MKAIFTLVFCFCTAFSALAQRDAIEEISKTTSSIRTMQCNFVQTKTLKMLDDKMVSKGKMWCTHPSHLRWEYTTPYSYSFILNENKVSLKKGNRNNIVNANHHKSLREIIQIMVPNSLCKILTEKKDYDVAIISRDKLHILELTPQKKEIKQMFSLITFYYNRQTGVMDKVEMQEKNGDCTVIEFSSVKKNITIDESVYKLK